MKPVVSYIRVSTQRQGISGLGLDSQRAAVSAFCAAQDAKLLQEYQDVESGRHNERKGLRNPVAHAKRAKATLVIAKLDRLARNVAFIANLMESDVEFAACDLPFANRLLLHIMAAVAEQEAKVISERTIAALSAAKARGTRLGATNPQSRNLSPGSMQVGRKNGALKMAAIARDFYAELAPQIRKMRTDGLSLATIARNLTDSGFLLRSGKEWNPVQVKRVLDRAQ